MEFNSSKNGGGLVKALRKVDPEKAQGGLVILMSEFDLDSDDGKQFGGFHASVIPEARVLAEEIDFIGRFEGEIDNLQWNPFNERLAK